MALGNFRVDVRPRGIFGHSFRKVHLHAVEQCPGAYGGWRRRVRPQVRLAAMVQSRWCLLVVTRFLEYVDLDPFTLVSAPDRVAVEENGTGVRVQQL